MGENDHVLSIGAAVAGAPPRVCDQNVDSCSKSEGNASDAARTAPFAEFAETVAEVAASLVLGGPRMGTVADLQRIAGGQSARASTGARLQPGARLVREWQGRTWTVEVIEGGFLMGGERFDSLSGIAKKITGAHWSGPRFFGLTGAASGKKASDMKVGTKIPPSHRRRVA